MQFVTVSTPLQLFTEFITSPEVNHRADNSSLADFSSAATTHQSQVYTQCSLCVRTSM